jgi:hypothetical protein
MTENRETAKMKFWLATKSTTIILIALIVHLGCAENYGRLQRSQEVNDIFKSYQVLSDHRYYYSGPEGRPEAILGIHRDYTLKTTQWTEVVLTENLLRKWVDWLNFHFDTYVRYFPAGYVILDPNGKQVGVWYSIWDDAPVIFKEDNVIEVYPPIMPDPFRGGGDDNRGDGMDD